LKYQRLAKNAMDARDGRGEIIVSRHSEDYDIRRHPSRMFKHTRRRRYL
jgi:hypothetical protein